MAPDIFQAITTLPWNFIHWWDDGITFSRRIFAGIKRNGPDWILTWLQENHVEVDENKMMLVNALSFYHAFTTYDKLLEFLRDNNWGGLKADRSLLLLEAYESAPEPRRSETWEERALRQRKERISEETEISSKDLVPIEVRYRCRHCGRVIEEGLRDETNTWKIFAICSKCSKVYELSQSEAVAKTERRWSM